MFNRVKFDSAVGQCMLATLANCFFNFLFSMLSYGLHFQLVVNCKDVKHFVMISKMISSDFFMPRHEMFRVLPRSVIPSLHPSALSFRHHSLSDYYPYNCCTLSSKI